MGGKNNILIVFCGMDGAGKTALASRAEAALQNKLGSFQLYHGHAYSASNNSLNLTEILIAKLKNLIIFTLPLLYLDNLLTYFLKYKKMLKESSVISDRYFYDKIARLLFFGACNRQIARIYSRFLPKPDYVFFLDADPAVVYARKSEYAKSDLVIFRDNYLFLANCLNATVINTEAPLELCLRQVLDKIMEIKAK